MHRRRMGIDRRIPALLAIAAGLWLHGAPSPACAEDKPIEAPPMEARTLGPAAARIGTAYTKQIVTTFATLEALMAQPPEDPDSVSEQWREHCAVPQQQLAEFRDALSKHLAGRKMPDAHAQWLRRQRQAWDFVARQGGQGLLYLSRMKDVVHTWTTQHMPKIKEQKKRFRKQGKELNDIYVDARARARMRGDFVEASKVVEARAAKALPMASTLGESLARFAKLIGTQVRLGDPKADSGLETAAIAAMAELKLAGEKFPAEPIWGTHGRRWGEYIFQQWKEYVATYKQYVELTASLRAGTLFRDEHEPLSGIKPYKKIGPEYERLFDELLERFEEAREKLRALRKQADEDERKTKALMRKYSALKDRDWQLRVARAGSPTEVREAKKRAGKRTQPGGPDYRRLWRQHVDDRDLPYEEMRKRETPEFRRAWERHGEQVDKELAAELKVLEKSQDDAQKDYEDWKRERDEAWRAHDRELEAHRKEWDELGVPEPLYVYERH